MDLDFVKNLYKEQHWRFHHTIAHVEYIIQQMTSWIDQNQLPRDPYEQIVMYSAIFHDAVYDPRDSEANEQRSLELWLQYAKEYNIDSFIANKVASTILSTKTPNKHVDSFEDQFNVVDWMYMGQIHNIKPQYGEMLAKYENNIFKEYQFVSIEKYVTNRIKFLERAVDKRLITFEVFDYLVPIVRRKYTIGIYAGSFNPFHIGHMNVLNKAEKVFDKVIVAQGINPQKTESLDDLHNVNCLLYRETDSYSNQLVDYINSKRSSYCNPILVRGLRNGYDLAQESNLISFVNEQADARGVDRIPVVYISCDKEFEHISSSAIKTLPLQDKSRYIPIN